jgi:hypothetical protein
MNLKDLLFDSTTNTSSGISDFIFLARKSDFAVDGIKVPTGPFLTPGSSTVIAGNHTFLVDLGFAMFEFAPDKNSLEAIQKGDKGFSKFGFSLKGIIPGSNPIIHEAIANVLNVPLIVLSKDANCKENLVYQLGDPCVFAYLQTSFKTGTTAEGIKGYEVEFTYNGAMVQTYAGEITRLPA